MRLVKTLMTVSLALTAAMMMAQEPFKDIVNHQYRDGQGPRFEVKKIMRETSPDKYPELEARILATLEAESCTDAGKRFCFQLLRNVAGPATVKVVSKYLLDETYHDNARYAIEGSAGADATLALRAALPQSSGRIKIGIITSLGARGDEESVKLIAAELKSQDAEMAAAAMYALGAIGSQEAAIALQATVPAELESKRSNSLLICAEKMIASGDRRSASKICQRLMISANSLVKIGTLGVMMDADKDAAKDALLAALKDQDVAVIKSAIKFLGSLQDKDVGSAMALVFPAAADDVKLTLMAAFAARQDLAAVPVVTPLLKSDDKSISEAAIMTLGAVGGVAELDALIALMKEDGKYRSTVTQSIATMSGAGNAIVARIKPAGDDIDVMLIESLAVRGDSSVVPGLMKIFSAAGGQTPGAIGQALGQIGKTESVDAILQLMCAHPDKAAELENAVVAIKKRESADIDAALIQALKQSSGKSRVAIIKASGRAGGVKAMEAIVPYIKSSETDDVDASVRGLCSYEGDEAIVPMVNALGEVQEKTHKVLLARAIVSRLNASGMDPEKKVVIVKIAIAKVPVVDEKKKILGALAGYACKDALALAESLQGEPELGDDAKKVYTKIKLTLSKIIVTTSHNNEEAGKMINGNRDDRWGAKVVQEPGQWLQIDLRFETGISMITMDATVAADDYPRKYDVLMSMDGKEWREVVKGGEGKRPVTEIKFATPQKTRFVKIIQQGNSPVNWWSIGELIIE